MSIIDTMQLCISNCSSDIPYFQHDMLNLVNPPSLSYNLASEQRMSGLIFSANIHQEIKIIAKRNWHKVGYMWLNTTTVSAKISLSMVYTLHYLIIGVLHFCCLKSVDSVFDRIRNILIYLPFLHSYNLVTFYLWHIFYVYCVNFVPWRRLLLWKLGKDGRYI